MICRFAEKIDKLGRMLRSFQWDEMESVLSIKE